MSTGYVIPLDPAQLSTRFQAPEQYLEDEEELELEEEGFGSILVGDGGYEERIAPLLDRIPSREADLIYLYFVEKKRQADIAVIFGCTQAAVSYRLDRGLQRIRFLLSVPTLVEEDIRQDLPEIFKPIDIDILVAMWKTTCQSEVANQLKLTQGRVRHRFFKAVRVLEEASARAPKFEPYYKFFSAVASKNFNVLRSVVLPQWSKKGIDECF